MANKKPTSTGLPNPMPPARSSRVDDIRAKPRGPIEIPGSGIAGRMPTAPGSAKSGQPPRREELGGDRQYADLDTKNAAWPKERVEAVFGSQRKSKIGAPDVTDLPDTMGPHIPPIPGHRLD